MNYENLKPEDITDTRSVLRVIGNDLATSRMSNKQIAWMLAMVNEHLPNTITKEEILDIVGKCRGTENSINFKFKRYV